MKLTLFLCLKKKLFLKSLQEKNIFQFCFSIFRNTRGMCPACLLPVVVVVLILLAFLGVSFAQEALFTLAWVFVAALALWVWHIWRNVHVSPTKHPKHFSPEERREKGIP